MTTSGTYTLNPEIAEFSDEAFERVGIDPASLTGRHVRSARMSLNLLFSDWATDGVHDFVCQQMPDIPLVVGGANYSIPVGTLAIIGPVFQRNGLATPINFISRADYERIPNKTYQGISTNLFFDRPTLTAFIWPVGQLITDSIGYWRLRRMQDVTAGSQTADLPYHWWEAMASGLAAKLAEKYNPSRQAALGAIAAMKFKAARDFDRERAPTSFTMARV